MKYIKKEEIMEEWKGMYLLGILLGFIAGVDFVMLLLIKLGVLLR